MATVGRKQQLFEDIARLRRIGRLMPDNEDLAAVRLGLERELGETVSRRLTARLLGVSHTALERWIKRGDVPLVFTPTGRQEIPVTSLSSTRPSGQVTLTRHLGARLLPQ